MNASQAAETLTAPANRALATQARRGDAGARERLILGNKGLVFHRDFVRRYRSMGWFLPFGDAAQEGWVALVKAADKYDPGQRAEFSTYAYRAVRNHLNNLLE